MMSISRRRLILLLLLLWLLSACQVSSPTETATPVGDETSVSATPTSEPSPTSEPVSSLTLCTVEIPESLFLYSPQSSPTGDAIMAVLYDDLINEGDGILSESPSEANGGLRLEPVSVIGGETVIDSRGELVVLKAGVTVRPSGCRDTSCTLTWDGTGDLQMDRMVLTFHLREGVTWSDGVPVTASDSVFSFELASAQDAPGLKWAERRTASYTAEDDQTVIWIGKPGFTTAELETFFWKPLPIHMVNGETEWSVVNGLPEFSSLPLSYGPFSIVSSSDEALQLIRNPYYYRISEGLPLLDEITLMAIGADRAAAVAALDSGNCDVLDVSFKLENDPALVTELQSEDAYAVYLTPGQSWVQLVFGITPASYDEYFNPLYGDRPDYFGNENVRQAIAMCLDKEDILDMGLSSIADLWSSFIPDNESQLPEEAVLRYDPSSAISLLEAAGWRDHDLNTETPLQAWEVSGVPVGTTFNLTLMTDMSSLQKNLAEIVQESLAQCGIGVDVVSLPAAELYAPGPDGPVFGRSFDLAFITWQPRPDLDCGYYQSWQTPSDENQWIGTNIAGFSDDIYDQACSAASLALPVDYADRLRSAETVFMEASVAVPLLSISQVVVAASNGCHNLNVSTDEDFFDLLEYYTCQ